MPLCSVFSITRDPCCDIHGEITKPGRQKTGFDNNKEEVGFWHQLMEEIYFATAELEIR